MRRRLLVVVFVTLMILPQIVAGQTLTHFVYTWHGANYHQYLRDKADQFAQLHPGVQVDIIIGAHAQFDVMLAGGIPPDILELPDYGHYTLEGIFTDLRPYMERDELLQEFAPPILDLVTAPDGGIYAMPLEVGMVNTIYNEDAFAERGLATPKELGNAWNWETVLDYGSKFTVDRDGDGIPEEFGIDRPAAMWRNAVHQAGGRFFDDPWRPRMSLWNSDEVLTGIEFVAQIYRLGITPHLRVPDPNDFHFRTGRTAINLVDGPGVIGATLEGVAFDYNLYLQPMGPQTRASAIGVAGPYILTTTQDTDLAWEWVKFVAADQANVEEWVRLTARIPAMTALQPYYAEAVGITHLDYRYIFDQVIQPNPYAYTLTPELNPRRAPDLLPVWRGDVAPQAFLENLHNQYSAIIQALYGTD